mmetsp:Transcript_88770/g.171901  ORF Transcript_88770/g.171901 Transcript_88770/m.171901 type:complete len:297 (+) Transcript_88770:114-1004(+)
MLIVFIRSLDGEIWRMQAVANQRAGDLMCAIEQTHNISEQQGLCFSELGGRIIETDEILRLTHGQTIYLRPIIDEDSPQLVESRSDENVAGNTGADDTTHSLNDTTITATQAMTYDIDNNRRDTYLVNSSTRHNSTTSYETAVPEAIRYGAIPIHSTVLIGDLQRVRRAFSFWWGLRIVCAVDAAFLFISVMVPLSSSFRLVSSLLLLGPLITISALYACSSRLIMIAMLYHSAAVIAFAVAGRGGNFWCGILPVAFHAWALSLLFRFLLQLRPLNEQELPLLRRLIRQHTFAHRG